MWAWCQGAWQGGGGGGGVEASGADGEPEELSGDTMPLGGVDMVWGGS